MNWVEGAKNYELAKTECRFETLDSLCVVNQLKEGTMK
jgi:hypothetical protein